MFPSKSSLPWPKGGKQGKHLSDISATERLFSGFRIIINPSYRGERDAAFQYHTTIPGPDWRFDTANAEFHICPQLIRLAHCKGGYSAFKQFHPARRTLNYILIIWHTSRARPLSADNAASSDISRLWKILKSSDMEATHVATPTRLARSRTARHNGRPGFKYRRRQMHNATSGF
ncbi:hypothetical protein CIHG_01074 [Coccidioides immitis H538.4]|uniref:Uncharacterized protein n=2 Tax=Coccidioides immitis TaxID=5501 RepID=A0A0J8REE9_COCIT|nr:hypothetical protein CIRG_03479 [Coccidioides immitis RMSCC 2394]KMU83292.1 hypothetical protein CIHG_01074 [Coccidioides immitis H538.4]